MVFCLRVEGVLSAIQSFLSLMLQGHDQTLADRLQNLSERSPLIKYRSPHMH